MASSGSTDFAVSRDDIVRMALLDVKAIGSNETPNATMVRDAVIKLNGMVKAWGADDIHVWTEREATLFPAVSQARYSVGPSASDHVTETYYETAISAAEASGQTVLSVDDTANMTVADNIGIVLDDGTLHWSTILSKTSTTVTIALALTDSAAAGNAVFNYTSKISRPLKIVDARVYNIDDQTDIPISLISRQEYNALSRKVDTGTPNQLFYEKAIPQGRIYIWQPLVAITDLVKFTWHRMIEDFDSAGNNPDLPVEWVLALEYNLAVAMLPQFPQKDASTLVNLAQYYLDKVQGGDKEDRSIFVTPDFGYSGYGYGY